VQANDDAVLTTETAGLSSVSRSVLVDKRRGSARPAPVSWILALQWNVGDEVDEVECESFDDLLDSWHEVTEGSPSHEYAIPHRAAMFYRATEDK
jgi:hypothetical protein